MKHPHGFDPSEINFATASHRAVYKFSLSCAKATAASRSPRSFMNLLTSGYLYDGFLFRPEFQLDLSSLDLPVSAVSTPTPKKPEPSLFGRLRVYTASSSATLTRPLDTRFYIECWLDGQFVGVVDSLTRFMRWCFVDVFEHPSYSSRQPFRELAFIDIKAGKVYCDGDVFRHSIALSADSHQ